MAIDQNIFNIVIGAAGALGGWFLKLLYDQIRTLQYDNRRFSDKVSSIEVLIAGQYVTFTQFNDVVRTINAKLDCISEKIDRKADK